MSLFQIVSPLSAYIQLFDIDSIPVDVQYLFANYSAASSVILTPSESSFSGVYFIISNIIPLTSLSTQPQFYQSGNVFASASNSQLVDGKSFIHIEAYKVLNGVFIRIDPTQFLQPDLDVDVSVHLHCNDIVTYIGGMVVERRGVVTSMEIPRMPVGEPLVQGNYVREYESVK